MPELYNDYRNPLFNFYILNFTFSILHLKGQLENEPLFTDPSFPISLDGSIMGLVKKCLSEWLIQAGVKKMGRRDIKMKLKSVDLLMHSLFCTKASSPTPSPKGEGKCDRNKSVLIRLIRVIRVSINYLTSIYRDVNSTLSTFYI